MKTVNTNTTGRFNVAKTTQEKNLGAIVSYMRDAVALTEMAGQLFDLSGNVIKPTGILDPVESFLAWGALGRWAKSAKTRPVWKDHSVASLVGLYASSVEAGTIVPSDSVKGLLELYKSSGEGLLTQALAKKHVAVPGVFDCQTYASIAGSRLKLRYLSQFKTPHRAARITGGKLTQSVVMIDKDTFSPKGLEMLSRVVVTYAESGVRQQYWNASTKSGLAPVTYRLNPNCAYIDPMSVHLLATLAGMEEGTMQARPGVHFGIELNNKGLMPKSPMTDPAYTGSVGITKGGAVRAGYALEMSNHSGWFEIRDGQVFSTEKAMHKAVARVLKLSVEDIVKDSVTLRDIFLVDGVVSGDPEPVLQALSTGVVWVQADTLIAEGQVRLVSPAHKLGLKGTLGPVAFISPDLEKRGIGLMSYGSAKAKGYGVKAMGLTKTQLETVILGESLILEGYMVSEVTCQVTNRFTVNEYRPASLETLVLDYADAHGILAQKALDAASKEDDVRTSSILLAKVKAKAAELGCGIPEALQVLEAEGVVKSKGIQTTWTATEFDVLASFHGYSKACEVVDDLLESPANKAKPQELKSVSDFICNAPVDESKVIRWSIEQVCQMAVVAAQEAGVSIGVLTSGAPSRAFLVNFVDLLYGVNEAKPEVNYVIIQGQAWDSEKSQFYYTECKLPVGKWLEGQTFKTSVFLENVVTSGFLSRLLPCLAFAAEVLAADDRRQPTPAQYGAVLRSIELEVEANICGKEVGRLNSRGSYHVLSVAPWAKAMHEVYAPNAGKFGKGNAIMVKHPVIFSESHAGCEVVSQYQFYKGLVADSLSEEKLNKLIKALGNTAFIHMDALLALENDADGDTIRLTWHKNTSLPMFQARPYQEGEATRQFHLAYREGERNFLGAGESATELKPVDLSTLAEACEAEAKGKDLVSQYTTGLQLFMQNYGGAAPKVEAYTDKVLVLGLFVQELAMNSIKHKTSNGKTAADWFFAKLPEEGVKQHANAAVDAYVAFVTKMECDARVCTRDFGMQLFWELHTARSAGRPAHVVAMSKDRTAQDVLKGSVKGVGLDLTVGGSMMNYIMGKGLSMAI